MNNINTTTISSKKSPNLLKDISLVNHSQINPHSALHKTFNFPQNSQNNKSFLDYTFISHKTKLKEQEEKHKALTKAKEYLFDLVNTWKLNLEMLKSLCGDDSITGLLIGIELKYKAQHDKIAQMKAKKSKILIESQIQEEYKRKIKESNQLYKDQIDATRDNVCSKEEYIKIFLKKLKEVEIFIQKHTKALNIKEFCKYHIWNIAEFLKENTSNIHKQKNLYEELEKIKHQILEIKQENYFYKEEVIVFHQKNHNKEMIEKQKKIEKYIENFRKRCHVSHNRIKLLKLTLNNMTTLKDLKSVSDFPQDINQKTNNKESQENKKEDIVNNGKANGVNGSTMIIDKTIEASKLMESLIDFSLLLKKENIEESNVKDMNIHNITSAWNLSCIQKKD